MPSLRIASPDKSAPRIYYLFKTLTTIGSGADCDVVLGDPLLPDVFAHIQRDGHECRDARALGASIVRGEAAVMPLRPREPGARLGVIERDRRYGSRLDLGRPSTGQPEPAVVRA